MAVKDYGYYIKGSKLCIVEREANFDNDPESRSYGPGVDRGEWKSPIATVADALRLEYTYVPTYFIETTDLTHTDIAKYRATNSGKLQLRGPDGTNYDTTMDAGNYIVLKNAGRFNGLHKIDSFANGGGTNDIIVLDTSYSGANSSWTDFEETVTMYYDVSAMIDESFELDVSHQQASAIVYYIKAKMMEDMGELERREYFLREFRRAVEKAAGDRKHGSYRALGFGMTR